MFTVNAKKSGVNVKTLKFQNISCLRLITHLRIFINETTIFQNISCLRLIEIIDEIIKLGLEFQNISCLRLIIIILIEILKVIKISKHFMFTVNK